MNCEITIKYLDDVHMIVDAKEMSIAQEIYEYFTFEVPGAKFTPAYRNKMWDGKIRLFNYYNGKLYFGLLPHLLEFIKDRGYDVCVDEKITKISVENTTIQEVGDYLETLNLHSHNNKLIPHEHQINAIHHVLSNNRALLLSPTASGKSLITYCLCRRFIEKHDAKILVVVPTVSLVSQLFSDFQDYSSHNSWNVESNVQKIHQGLTKKPEKNIVISTYQSIYDLPPNWYNYFDTVIIDEAHGVKSTSIKGILEKLKKCPRKIGMTGTLDGTKTHKIVIEGLTGKVHKVTSTKELMDKDLLSKLQIKCLFINHPDEDKKAIKGKSYIEEIGFIIANSRRNNFIADLSVSLKGNTLLLYQYVDNHGKILKDLIDKKVSKDRKVFFVSGEVEAEVRENIRKIINDNFIYLHFNDKIIKVSQIQNIPLSDGSFKLAKYINMNDDILDKWITENTK